MFLLLVLSVSTLPAEIEYGKYLIAAGRHECLLVRDPEAHIELNELLQFALQQGFRSIRIQEGDWEIRETISLQNIDFPVWIRGESEANSSVIRSGRSPAVLIRRSSAITLQNLIVEGGIDLEESDTIVVRSVVFRQVGIHLAGNRCNQPNECTGYNRNVRIEDCTFQDCEKGIFAERLESSLIQNNRFAGARRGASCERIPVGIELDGSSEDLDRPLEQGHSKSNRIVQNTFEQDSAVGIRVRKSLANTLRDNEFRYSYRALEFLDGARYNQILTSSIGYLSQQPSTSACPGPCGIYLGPGSFNNIFVNTFFEQSFELQFLENHRNRTFVIDESGGQNIFRSDFLRINP